MNRRAIVIYLDFIPDQFKMFKMLLRSLELINATDTDLVVFFNPLYNNDIRFENSFLNESCEVKFFGVPDLKYSDEFFGYEYINSIACMVDKNWLNDYEFILKTDTDTLLTKKWNTFFPENFTVGQGGYINDTFTSDKIAAVALKHGLLRTEGHLKNLGSTWYGKSDEVLKAATLTTSLVSYFLNNEFAGHEGKWPGYYKGVSTLYASEIALNYLIKKIDKDTVNLDFPSDSSEYTSEHVHIHCWHTKKKFSKMAFFNGEYNKVNIDDLDLSVIANYSLYCALSGNS